MEAEYRKRGKRSDCCHETAQDKHILLQTCQAESSFRSLKISENPTLPLRASTLKVFVVTHICSRWDENSQITTSTNFMLMPRGMRSRSGFDASNFQHGMQAVVTHSSCSEVALGTAGPRRAVCLSCCSACAAAPPLSPAQHHGSHTQSSPGHCLLQTARRDYL